MLLYNFIYFLAFFFVLFFITEFVFLYFLMKYQILQENINQSETGIGGRELPVELYVTLEAKGHIVHFKKICFYVPLVKTSH